ncbi:MAG: universal stress protein [Candidatus Nitrosocosmicus sp.]|jgi:nucleotide-binding universal stress UspA family protein|uniref:universal stress protein n=1 Tax=Candidatus Nitrosocosmicus agrestis TaxID=2563600 RepID=UPI00122DD009|nr:universal stress protein [Candidatus Nitrosocosmicus sp. SS]KAA2283140.1 universal stress protein [Candidatus Nitrosocosmicus sp. SS]KAF0868596.1 universal stress protein [Candidatus Nitrosocosmicus sp. SS]MDR4490021.1 universal stress protein [Candidatus Nitrosocosmicus sp.]HET7644266.1 universal stress protein [Nitrososphaeraceae archaeon]
MPFNRILVPFDTSKLSIKALEKAIELSSVNQSPIFILHVINEIPLPIHYSKIELKNNEITISPLVNKLHNEIKNEMIGILDDVKKTYAKHNVQIMTEIKIGDPAETIIDFTKRNDIDLIVMGSIGHKGISGMFKKLGSVARKVAEEVNCALLIVR